MQDNLLVYPMGKVVGIAPDQDVLEAANDALRGLGIDEARVEVLAGDEGAHRIDATGKERGVLATALRRVQKAFGEETTRLEVLNEAVESGQFVIQIDLDDKREGEDAYDDEKRAIGSALNDAGATNVAYYGKHMIEELQLGA